MDDIDRITEDQWKEYLKHLMLHVARQFQKRGWGSVRKGWSGPKGTSPDDIAQEAIRRVYERERVCNPAAYESFLQFLRATANSLMSHLAESVRRKNVVSLSQLSCDEDAPGSVIEPASTSPGPLQDCIGREVRDKIAAAVLCHFGNDPLVLGIVDCLDGGITKREEIAEYLSVDPREIDNAKKRLRRKLESELSF